MQRPVTRTPDDAQANYIERNRHWLMPLFFGIVLLAAHAVGKVIASRSGGSNPLSFSIIGWFVGLAFSLAGLGAWVTDTASARVVSGIAMGMAMVAMAMGLVVVFWNILDVIAS